MNSNSCPWLKPMAMKTKQVTINYRYKNPSPDKKNRSLLIYGNESQVRTRTQSLSASSIHGRSALANPIKTNSNSCPWLKPMEMNTKQVAMKSHSLGMKFKTKLKRPAFQRVFSQYLKLKLCRFCNFNYVTIWERTTDVTACKTTRRICIH